MALKLNGSTAGSVSIDAPADTSPTGTDVTLTLPTNAGSSGQVLTTDGSGTLSFTTLASDSITEGNTTVECVDSGSNGHITFDTEGSERARFDSSGRLLIGRTASQSENREGVGYANLVQIEGSATGQGLSVANSADAARINISRDIASDNITTNMPLGYISFGAESPTTVERARIQCDAEFTNANERGGRLRFFTNPDGDHIPQERMTINNAGRVILNTTTNTQALVIDSSSATIATRLLDVESTRSAHPDYTFFAGLSGDGTDVEHRLRGDGNALCDGSFTGGGADYAEYFEWSDSNPDEEDRRGISVVLDQDKIREAVAGEDPIGVISGNPSVVGDAAWNKWDGKYLRDDFGTYIQEDYEVEDEDGNTVVQQRRTLNPAYDPDVEYVNRENRPEWDCVGLMGKLRIRKGQVTGARWIKMRDVSDTVEEWLVR